MKKSIGYIGNSEIHARYRNFFDLCEIQAHDFRILITMLYRLGYEARRGQAVGYTNDHDALSIGLRGQKGAGCRLHKW